MKTLLGATAAVVGEFGLVRLSNRFRHRSPGCSAFISNRCSRVLFPRAAVMPSVPLNAGVNERYMSCRTLE
jgi:hypothetical protein